MPVIKWYLNLERRYGGTNKDRAGQAIGLIAKRNSSQGRGNFEVAWNVVEAGPHDGDCDYVPNPHRSTLAAARTAEQNGEFRNTLNLTNLGGRTFTVTAAKVGDANNSFNQQYQSWRRIYYSIHHMNDRCKTLFESVEQEIKDIFAGVFIELKPRGKRACIVNEATTDAFGPNGLTLAHTYNPRTPQLDRSPHHLRVVIVRDVVKSRPFAVHWTMDSATATPANRLIRISSERGDHSMVVYTNDIAAINALDPADTLTVSVHSAAVAIPDACIERNAVHGLRVNLGADQSTIAIRTALKANQKANLTGTVRGRRCAAGFAASIEHPIQATLTSDNVELKPVVVGTAKIWIEEKGASVLVEDPRIVLARPRGGDQLRLTLSDASTIDIHDSRVHRVDDHKLWLNLGGEDGFLADIARHPVQISLRRHGLLAKGPLEATADYSFDLREFSRSTSATRRKVFVSVNADDGDGRIDVSANWLALAANAPLTMRVETLGVPIPVPAAALRVPSPERLEIDLNAHQSLQTALQAMAGGKLTFDGKLKGLHSLGGYSPDADRSFIALTSLKLTDDETDEKTARRMKLVFCHEVGHALGLNFPWVQNQRLARRETNDLRYVDEYGGTGPHCSHRAQLEPSGADHGHESTTSGEIYVSDGTGPLCIMYHTMDLAHMGDDFCPNCKAHLRRKVVSL